MDKKLVLNVSVLLRLSLFIVGVHSALLGGIIYLFTTQFYQFFFSVDPDNIFFIKQSGVFLFLAGLFYLIPVLDMKQYKYVIVLVILSKLTAVTFLVINAYLTPSPFMIYLAALGDATMAIVLSLLSFLWYKNNEFYL